MRLKLLGTLLPLALVACATPNHHADGGVRTRCGSIAGTVLERHDPTVVVSVGSPSELVLDVSTRRDGTLTGLDGHIDRARVELPAAGAECSAASGAYRFDVGARVDRIALELTGVGPAQVVVEHDGVVLRRAFVDVSAEEQLRITL